MNKSLKDVESFYDDLIYGDVASLDGSETMLKAFPYPTLAQLRDLSVLEVGLGRAEWSIGLATHAGKYTGLDLSGKTLAYAQRELSRLSENVRSKSVLSRGSVLHLPFPNEHFDVIYCVGVLHATPDAYGGFGELFRVLRPRGTINLMLYGRVQPRNSIRNLLYGFSRLGRWAENSVLRLILWLEKWRISDAWLFRADGNQILYRDWYFAPIQSHHTVQQISSWSTRIGGEVTYVFIDPYRDTLKRHQRLARSRLLGRFLCPDFMISVRKTV